MKQMQITDRDLIARLAAYEDTGLEPEDVERILDKYGRGITLRSEIKERLDIICDIPTDRLRAVIQRPNPPLTLEELREMDGEPVWCQADGRPGAEGWFLVDASALEPYDFIAVGKERGIPCAGIESGFWLAYRRKPEEGTR